ncbi:cyanuric acid amidohydrolase [Paenibacillus endophyticus]|uniref:Cyanuric acid amidohydrolase n=1 Tax=Paenibacillus endophyticus TaxID=1294268 RepID=A0A7W5C5Q2_9BACL|nr:ring-opening amidohydrolase [Paenibacillus endophyticus]MBB3150574.1 cyanuric acid amidohydrolase [Paenibacillus endophyticus]
MMKCTVVRVPSRSPNDVTALDKSIKAGLIEPQDIVAVLGKTEGNGCVNDFTRGYAVLALKSFFAEYRTENASSISYVMSGGTEGILSPHFTVISRKGTYSQAAAKQDRKSLAIGVAKTADFLPEEIGRLAQVDEVAAAVRRAIAEAGIESASDVHFVQIKCPLLTADQVHDARNRAASTVTEDTYKSMGYSRGASALGAAIALGEVDREKLEDEDICSSWQLFSRVASTSAGSELSYCEIIVFGNSAYADGPYFIAHDVMKDAIDASSLTRLLDEHQESEMVQVLAKAEADPSGYIRGHRHTMLDDSDINHTRHARAVVGGVLASVCGDPMIYVSGGAEHQGPPGGGPVAVVFKRRE